jgi:hydrogenase-4 membrane subunit HyfE
MENIKKVVEFLKGKKAYIIGSLMIVLGILQKDNQLILEGLSVITLRAGLAKI